MKLKMILALVAVAASLAVTAETVKWEFPREQPQEGIPFADSKTGILIWNGDGVLDVTVGRGDWWEHRGGSVWQESQSYTNIIALVKKGGNLVGTDPATVKINPDLVAEIPNP